MATEEQLDNLRNARARLDKATKDCGKNRGGTGGWKVEGNYRAASAEYNSALVAAGVGVSKNKKFTNTYYILGDVPSLEG